MWNALDKASGPKLACLPSCMTWMMRKRPKFSGPTPKGTDGEGFCEWVGPEMLPAALQPGQYRGAGGIEEFADASTSSSANNWCYETAGRSLPSARAPRRPIFMGEEPFTSRL